MKTMTTDASYVPPLYLRNPMLQTFLNSAGLRGCGRNSLRDAEQEIILELGEVRLQGFLSRRGQGAKGMVMLLHGWGGSAHSAYILRTGRYLFDAGYDVFRLNFRDHGNSHHLNKGFFIADSLGELYDALKAVARLAGQSPLFLAGFSMGANFAVRAAARYAADPIPVLKRILAINPSVEALAGIQRLDRIPLIKRYFLRKWKSTLARKQCLFPDLYDFSNIMRMQTAIEIGNALIERYLPYRSPEDYYGRFTLTQELFDAVQISLYIIMSEDDPLIPIQDLFSRTMNANTHLLVQRYGGHCGYITNLSMQAWYLDKMLEIFV
ncbi:MAG TPA: alpha/beta fold hydrolase [Syntrophorhabdaceae bacterium]|nr:alpha/beta fold hydrolase [Syntrophorhabdaceae bacterium]HPA07201.1 alpha/beta fold hydrolase [Methanoregulaceae archaeon]